MERSYIITIDGGTTNTRCILWDNSGAMLYEERRQVGVRDTAIDGNNQKLRFAVKECIEALLKSGKCGYGDIVKIVASGMLTSELGLFEVPHLAAPAGISELAASLVTARLDGICPVPISFVPGIKNRVKEIDSQSFEAMDIMRGEEVESIAIIDRCFSGRPMLIVLPGSHNKFVAVNAKGQIAGCLSTISGELLEAVTNHTILAKSVRRRFAGETDYSRDWMLTGYRNAKKVGLGRACFSGRILNLFGEKSGASIASYILGAVLQGDVHAVLNSDAISYDKTADVVVSGKPPFGQALLDIFEFEDIFASVQSFAPENGISASALGAYLLAVFTDIYYKKHRDLA